MKKMLFVVLFVILLVLPVLAREINTPLDINVNTLAGYWQSVGNNSYFKIYTNNEGNILEIESNGRIIGRNYLSVIHHASTDVELVLYPVAGYPPFKSVHIFDFTCNDNGTLSTITWTDGIGSCWMTRLFDW